jgi:TolB-like protein
LLLSISTSVYAQSTLEQRVDDLSRQIAGKVSAKQKTTIAVVEFADLEGHVTNFGRFLAEELITRFYETDKFKVIERQLLNKVINEQKLSLTGMVDPTSAKKLGRLLGVDAIVSGSVSDLGKSLRVNARLISTETGEVFAVASTEVVKDEAVIKLMGEQSTDDGRGSRTKDESSSQTKKPIQTVKASLYTFDLQQCRLSGNTVVCDLTITNNDKDRMFSFDNIVGGAGMVDDLGGTYQATSLQVANRNGFDDAVIPSNVPVKSRVTFDNVSNQATRIVSLRMQFNRYDPGINNHFRIEFRDVPLSK